MRMTAAIAIVLAFLEPPLANERARQDLQETRIRQVDEILTACKLILEVCGRCRFLSALHSLWEDLSGGLFTLERQLWPEQAPETPLAFAMPAERKPLGELLLPEFQDNVAFVRNGMHSLDLFHTWCSAYYDAQVHAAFFETLEEATMILRTIDTMFRMKQRIMNAGPRAPIDLDAPDEAPATRPGDTAGTAAASSTTNEPPMELHAADGTPLQWY